MPLSAWFGAAAGDWFGTPDPVSEARASAAALGMPDRCAIKGWLTVRNARGNVVDSKEFTRATDVPIRIQRDLRPVFGAESGGVYGRQAETIDTSAQAFAGALPWGTTVLDSDHIVMDSGTQYEVTSVDAESSYGVEVVVGLVRLGLDNPDEAQ